MSLLRRSLLTLADSDWVESLMRRNGATKGLVGRFVAGEDLDAALATARRIAAQGMTTTLDHLGENVGSEAEARAAVPIYVEILERMAQEMLEPNISVKLTMLGLDLDPSGALARENMEAILAGARRVVGFVRIDMEGSTYTQRTMDLFEVLHDRYPDEVGIVIQAYLRRAREDVERMIARQARVRLVKGAYAEPADIAYQGRDDIVENYVRLMEPLLARGRYPAIATHDPDLIRAARNFAAREGIPPDRYEFQMLYGVRRDEQTALTQAGYRMRVYVPYGTEWYPYFMRRIAERPANTLFALRQIISR